MEEFSSIWKDLPSEISSISLQDDPFWASYEKSPKSVSVHIAILSSKYLEMILDLQKTIESRFSIHRRLPYKRVNKGDVILLKQSGGPILGVSYVEKVWFFELKTQSLNYIKKQFGSKLCIQDDAFWIRTQKANYATLISLSHVKRIDPVKFSKRDRNAWAIFEYAQI